MSGICIQRDIIGDVFYSTFTDVFYSCHVFNVFNVFLFFFNVFYIYAREGALRTYPSKLSPQKITVLSLGVHVHPPSYAYMDPIKFKCPDPH